MIDDKDIEEYRKIKAPSELKTRIMLDCETASRKSVRAIGGAYQNRQMIRTLSALAACLVLAVGIFSVTRMGSSPVTLSYCGMELTEEHTAVGGTAMMRLLPDETTPLGVPLEIETRKTTKITVSGGCLYREGDNGEDPVSCGTTVEIEENTTIWWAVENTTAQYELTVNADGKETVYILETSPDAPNGVIYKK